MRKGLAYDPFAEIVSPVQNLPEKQQKKGKGQENSAKKLRFEPKNRKKMPVSRQNSQKTEELTPVLEEKNAPEVKERLERLTINVRSSVADSARNACWWCRISLTDFVQNAIEREVTRLQDERNSGEPFESRAGELKPGRPLGS